MKNKSDIQFVLDRWFEEGPTVAPDHVLNAALKTIDETKQRRVWDASWRNWSMSNYARIAAAAVLILAVGAVAFAVLDRNGSPIGTESGLPRPSGPPSGSPQPTESRPAGAAFTLTGQMNGPHEYHTATLLRDGKVLVAGGDGLQGLATTSAEVYDPNSRMWSATGHLITARQFHTATLLADGRVLIAGGFTRGNGAPLASAELYDPQTGTWAATGNMTAARWGQTATLLPDGRVLVAGGCSGLSDFLSSAELYDPQTGTWTATGRMVTSHCLHTATLLLNGEVLIAGEGGSEALVPPHVTAELYDPSSGTWIATGNLVTDRLGHSATLLADGRVLVAGGNGVRGSAGHDVLGTAELYDPGRRVWSATGSMSTLRLYAATSLLADGRVLVTGGDAASGETQASAEIYDPLTGTWSVTATMSTTRHSHTATLLADGTVLIAGGEPAATLVFLDSAELYRPGP